MNVVTKIVQGIGLAIVAFIVLDTFVLAPRRHMANRAEWMQERLEHPEAEAADRKYQAQTWRRRADKIERGEDPFDRD